MAKRNLTELKIPADAEFIPVAKRVASTLASRLGFGLTELDELSIAVSQACDSAVEASQEAWGGGATLKLTYFATDRGVEVVVEAVGPRSPQALPRPHLRVHDEEMQRLGEEMIRMFVDDFRSQVDAVSGLVRFRMVKYLIG